MSKENVENTCQHDQKHFDVFLFESKCDVYEVEDGQVVEDDEDLEPAPTDAVSVSCKQCGELWEYTHAGEAPEWVQQLYRIARNYAYNPNRYL